jgi:hypothetical protein
MSNRRRAKRPGSAELTLVSDPGSEADEELAELRELLLAVGAPPDVLNALNDPDGPAQIMRHLVEAGMLPTPEESFAGLVEGFRPLLKARCEALDAEIAGYEFLGLLRATTPDPGDVPEMLAEMIGQAEAYGQPESLAMLRVLGAIGPLPTRAAASAAADRMVAGRLADRPWVAGLGAPQPGPCFGYADFLGAQEAIALTFGYGRRRHALAVLIDHDLGGGVKDCWVTDGPDRLRTEYQQAARRAGLEFHDYQPEQARAIMDRALSKLPCPAAPDQVEDVRCYLDLLRERVTLLPRADSATAAQGTRPAGARPVSARTDRTGRTVHRLKIGIRGAKPPIWRRLEVSSGCTLLHLHGAIQESFGWQDCHPWMFQTPSGDFGTAAGLGLRSAATAKLHDVAARRGDRIGYTYDFGDEWMHDITVEDVVDAEPGTSYPRCLAGRRAGPPEDCGGIWGYQDLLDILADPGHQEHLERLAWLGLACADDFGPAGFDVGAVNKALSKVARVLVRAPRH